jgi:hypothetical protein
MAPETYEPSRGPLAELRQEAAARLDALIEATAEAGAELRSYQSALEASRAPFASGGSASEMGPLADVATVRSSLNEELARMDDARGAFRLAVWRLLNADGMTITDIASAWGVSRQLVSRELAKMTNLG